MARQALRGNGLSATWCCLFQEILDVSCYSALSTSRYSALLCTGYPPDHINAVITHTIHFLGLLAFYLGIKLPFEIIWSGNKFGVGQPWIGACRGTESGSWAKYVLSYSHCQIAELTPPIQVVSKTSSPFIFGRILSKQSFLSGNTHRKFIRIVHSPDRGHESNTIVHHSFRYVTVQRHLPRSYPIPRSTP